METIESKFNEAQFQMIRGHEIQANLNLCKLNLVGWNNEFNDYNYKIVFLLLTNLYSESSPKFTDTEKKQCEDLKNKIEYAMMKFPIHKTRRNLEERKTYTDGVAYKIIKDLLFEYEIMIRKHRDKHGLSSPNKKGGLF
jgi:hypothetical protein